MKTINEKEEMMKKAIVALACALIAPVAFAQTSTTTTETTTEPATTTQTTSTTYTAGTVTTYEPGKTVIVKGEQGPSVLLWARPREWSTARAKS